MTIHPEIKVEMLIPWTGLYQINQELNGFVLFTSYKTSLSDKSHVHSMYTLVMKLSNCWEQKVVSIYKWRILRLSRMDKESFTKDGSARISPAWIEWLKWWWIPQVVIEHLPVWSTVPLHPWIKILYHIEVSYYMNIVQKHHSLHDSTWTMICR